MKKLFAFLAVLFVSLGAKAIINVYNNDGTKINGETGYAIYSWSSPDELVAFLNGSYTGEVYYNSSPVSSYATAQWFTDLKAATAIKIGGSQEAPYEVVNTSCLQALSVLTGVKYLDMDLATPTEDIDFSQITVGSTNVELVTLPSGVTKEQVIAANDVLKTKGAKAVVGITGETVINQVPHYTYTLPGSSEPIEYTGEVSGDDVSGYTGNVSATIRRELSNAEDYPKHYYTNKMNDDIPVALADADVKNEDGTYKTSWIPAEFEITLIQYDTPTIKYYVKNNDNDVEIPSNWGWAINGFYNPDYTTTTTTLTAEITIDGNSYQSGTTVYKDIKHNYTYTYKPFNYNNGSNSFFDNEVSYTGSTKPYKKEGSDTWYGIINDNTTIEFPVTSSFSYTYNNLEGQSVTIAPSSTPHATGYVDLEYTNSSQELTKTIVPESSFVVDGMTAIVNEAGYLDDVRTNMFTKDQLTRYKGAKNITVIGNINNSDLTELSETNFGSVEYLNMKDAVLDGNITTISSKGTAAIILPAIKDGSSTRNVSKMELGAIQAQGGWSPVYHCLSYFDKDDATKMYIYAFDAAVAKLGDAVSNNIAITFIPMYNTDGEFAQFLGYHFQDDNESIPAAERKTATQKLEPFREALGQLPAISMDLSIVDQRMNPIFTGLDANTHYLTVMGNVNKSSSGDPYRSQYDFTGQPEGCVYQYPSTVWVVSAYRTPTEYAYDDDGNLIPRLDSNGEPVYDEQGNPKYQRTGDASKIHYAGKFLEVTEPTNLIYVRSGVTAAEGEVPSSLLGGAKSYFSHKQLFATRQIFIGSYNEAEIAEIDNDIHGNVFDFMTGTSFSTVTVGEGDAAKTLDCVVNLDNDNVKYILLPDNHEADINATSPNSCSFSGKCAGLLCVGAYNTETNTLTTWSSAPGNVYAVTSLIRPQKTGRGTGLICASLNNVVMSGKLNWDDISTNTDNGKNNGLENATVLTADLTNAFFPDNEDMVFSTASWGSITSILLPTSSGMTLIPDYCLSGAGVLTEICIPSNYETIGIDAFFGTDLTHVYTTAYPGDENNFIVDTDGDGIADVYDHGDHTITLSSNLQEIRRGAFCTKIGNANKGFSDVYVLRAEAPKCEGNAFHSVSYMGNNTFAGSTVHPISRGSYEVNHGYLAVLHYPSSVTEEQEAKFTDVTRDYTLTDEMGMYNNKGEIISWPRQTEFLRAYNQAVSGVTWKGWPTTRPYGSIEDAGRGDYNEIIYDGTSAGLQNGTLGGTSMYYGQDSAAGTIGLPDPTGDDNDYPGSYNEDYAYDWANYMGWHQFVLTNGNSTQQKKTVATEYVNGGWYTLCLPYDMTAAEVVEAMGAPANSTFDNTKGYNYVSTLGAFPRVYSLRTVKRDYPNIDLKFSLELMKQTAQGTTLSFDNENGTIDYVTLTADEMYKKKGEVVYLRGGYPYLVRPLVPKDNPNVIGDNLGNYILKNMQFDEDDLGNKAEVKTGQFIAMPIISQKILALNKVGSPVKFSSTDGDVLDTEYYYYFQGTYADQDMPEAYYLSDGSWNRQRKESPKQTWEGFTAIIGGKAHKTTGSIYKTDNPSPTSFTGITTYYVSLTSKNDDFTKVGDNRVKYQFLFEGEEGFDEAVAIDKIDGKDINAVTEGNVYNMAGQLVGSSLDGLAKGLYIQNGKKVMVK